MSEVIWRARALRDVERLHAFLRNKNKAAAAQAAQIILEGALLLEQSPHIGRPMHDDTGRRELIIAFGAGGYVIRYGIAAGETVVILRVWHSRESKLS